MAEIVVSFLPFLLEKLGNFIVQEARSLRGVEVKVQWIKQELERINAFLRVADADEKARTNPQLQLWVKQVRDIAYDIEDILDEFMLRMPQNQVDGFHGFIGKIRCGIKKTKYRRQLASSIQAIESSVKEVSEGQKRYESPIMNNSSRQTSTRHLWHEHRADALWVKEAELVGIDKNRDQLVRWLVDNNNPEFQVISVVGMGGLGKTTLAKKAYDADPVKNHFQCHALVNFSQSFNLEMLMREVIRQLFKEGNEQTPERLEAMGTIALKETINNFLQHRSYIIFLDDVWKIEHWNAIKAAFPPNNFNNRIMLTTRLEDVAKGASREPNGKVFPLEPLSFKDSATLFCRKTFQEDFCPGDLKDIVQHILNRCEGLPLAIVAISGMLATKSRSRDEWEMVKHSLGDELGNNYVSKILSLSYYDLPYYLKSCFLYLSAFPEDYVINCKTLVRLWVAEGFVEAKEGKTLEEVATSYLTQLVNRSLIQVVKTDISDRIAKECRIHDQIRDLIIRMSKEQKFMSFVARTSTTWPENTRRLSIIKTMGDVKEIKGLRQLRSLLMIQSYFQNFQIPKGVKLLRLMHLPGLGLTAFPNEICNMYHLRYLSFRGNFELRVIPDSIGRLVNLELLDFRGSSIFKVPAAILKLGRLCHLLGGDEERPFSYRLFGFEVMSGIGCLHALQTLYLVDLKGKEGIVKELGELKHLRKLGIMNLREKEGPDFCSSIENLHQLRNLYVRSNPDGDEILDLQSLCKPPKFLEYLTLWGRLGTEPKWLSCLHSLIKLSLINSQLQEHQLVSLQSLPNLISLSLSDDAYVGETLCFKASSFKKLRFLAFGWLRNLRQVTIEDNAMSSLEKLSFHGCGMLEKMPFGIEKLTNLKSLILNDVSDDVINSVDWSKGGEDYCKVQNIPTIFLWSSSEKKWLNIQKGRE